MSQGLIGRLSYHSFTRRTRFHAARILTVPAYHPSVPVERIINSPNRQKYSTMTTERTNDLINTSSPYLLQHAHNPVHWIPWSADALSIAKREDKMIFLSIGYMSCHCELSPSSS